MTLVYVAVAIAAVLLVSLIVAQRRVDLGPLLKSDQEIGQAAREGKVLLALKSYRTLHGVGLKQAKTAIAKLATDAESNAKSPTSNGGTRSKP